MTNSLSNLGNKLAEEINKIKYGHDEKTVKRVELNTEIVKAVLNIQELDHSIEYKCLCCNKNYQNKFNEYLKKQFANTYKFSNHDINSLFYCCRKVFTHV